jgi:DNA replication and repair protein RecF
MPLISLSIDQFRNLAPVTLRFSPHLNLFIGANAAGKTSLLESLYVLARARSFRARSLEKAIQMDATGFQLVAMVRTAQNRDIPVGLQCGERKLIARVNGQAVKRLSDLAALFPVQWLGGNLHRLIEEGPGYRRQYLDWGLFHVKPAYVAVWKRFQKLLKQRNAALRTGVTKKEIQAWDYELATSAEDLHRFREYYISNLADIIINVSRELLDLPEDIQISYRKGWALDMPYLKALQTGLDKDREQKYTRSGPQRAELLFIYRNRPVQESLSRGQQKLFVLALQVAQAGLLRQLTSQTSLFLMDDLGAELDTENQQRVMSLLQSIEAQAFVTAIDDPGVSGWNLDRVNRFHVKHGFVSEVL